MTTGHSIRGIKIKTIYWYVPKLELILINSHYIGNEKMLKERFATFILYFMILKRKANNKEQILTNIECKNQIKSALS